MTHCFQRNILDHYRNAFKKFAQGKKLVWNWAAGLFSYYWFLYRRLPHWVMFLFSFRVGLAILFLLLTPLFAGVLFYINIIIDGWLGDRLLINYIEKQKRKGNFEGLPKGGATGFIWASTLTPFFLSFSILVGNLISLLVIPLIAIIQEKYKVRVYKNNNKS